MMCLGTWFPVPAICGGLPGLAADILEVQHPGEDRDAAQSALDDCQGRSDENLHDLNVRRGCLAGDLN